MIIQPLSDLEARVNADSAYRLRRIMALMDKASTTDYRSPMYDARPREDIVDIFRKIGPFGHPEMDAIDNKEIENIGPYSVLPSFSESRDLLEKYYENADFHGSEFALGKAKGMLFSILPGRSLRISSLERALEAMPKDTNLGAPRWSRERKYVDEYLARAHSITSYEEIYPYTLFRRGQPSGGPIAKRRHVFGADHVQTILAKSVVDPLVTALRSVPGFAAWNDQNYIDRSVTGLLLHAARNSRTIVSGDYSKFDASALRRLIDIAFDAIEWWFGPGAARRINILRESFCRTSLICPDGVWTERNGAVPSGAGETNLIDCLLNLLAGWYVSFILGVNLERYEVLGDDSVFVFSADVTSELTEVMKEVHLTMNPDKQFISDRSCHYLQRWHSIDYMLSGVAHGVRSPFRALNGMLSYERMRTGWNKYMDSARWIMQCENVRWDKRFKLFVKLVKQGDSVMSSGIDPVKIFKLAGGATKIRSVMGIESFPFNVKNPEGVDSFVTTRVLRSL